MPMCVSGYVWVYVTHITFSNITISNLILSFYLPKLSAPYTEVDSDNDNTPTPKKPHNKATSHNNSNSNNKSPSSLFTVLLQGKILSQINLDGKSLHEYYLQCLLYISNITMQYYIIGSYSIISCYINEL